MKIGLIDVDNHDKPAKFPNIALMKLSAWHKAQGDDVSWWFGFEHYDRVYMSKVFDETYTKDMPFCIELTCPYCSAELVIPWNHLNVPDYWGDRWDDIECPECGEYISLGDYDYD